MKWLGRFWDKVSKLPSGCWEWTAARSHGYGVFCPEGKSTKRAHRISYELAKGPIPDGLHLDHLCRNRPCVNPDHLEPVTNRVNSLRGVSRNAINAAKTACGKGHPFDRENTYLRKDRPGWRQCKACSRAATKAFRQMEATP